jgi:LmbE family N-acetylglucosaminyl deacetylase
MTLVVSPSHLGTSEHEWLASDRLRELRPIELPAVRRIIVVAPHPDDEVLGAAGLLQFMLHQSVRIEVVAVTDGESAYPELDVATQRHLGPMRANESVAALHRLGLEAPHIHRLHIPDGQVCPQVDHLSDYLVDTLGPGDLCVAPWSRDGHPDHDACGQAARWTTQVTGAAHLSYLVWAWHWARPEGEDLPWSRCRRLDLTTRAAARKRWAIGAFASQIGTSACRPDQDPILLPSILRRFYRPFEVFITEGDV